MHSFLNFQISLVKLVLSLLLHFITKHSAGLYQAYFCERCLCISLKTTVFVL